MVQVSFDTNSDSVEELEHALNILQTAIGKKRGVVTNAPHDALPVHAAHLVPKLDIAPPAQDDETILDTPFLKIKAHDAQEAETKPAPTLNQLLEEASLSDDDFAKLFKEQMAAEPAKPKKETQDSDGYIEIVDYAEEK